MNSPTISKLPALRMRTAAQAPLFDRDTVLTANGRTAICLGLRTLGMPAGARVLMPEWHCGSEIDAVIATGGTPVLYRLDDTMSADLDDLAEKLSALRPYAVYCTHYFGYPQPLDAIRRLTEQADARLIEDLALGLLSRPGDAGMGYSGDMTVYSLVKTLPLGDGGALWLKDGTARDKLKAPGLKPNLKGLASLRRRGRPGRGRLVDRFAGSPEAALDAWDRAAGFDGSAPLRSPTTLTRLLLDRLDLDGIRRRHRENYASLWAQLSQLPGVRPLLPPLPHDACPPFFPAWVPDEAEATALLAGAGVESVRFWRRFHPLFGPESSERLRDLKRHVLRLPIHAGVDADGISRMTGALAQLRPRPAPG